VSQVLAIGSRTPFFVYYLSVATCLCTALHVRGLTAVEAAVSCCELCGSLKTVKAAESCCKAAVSYAAAKVIDSGCTADH
jgi:hypothetical protein